MNLLKLRKIFLSAGCLILLVISVCQIVVSKKDSGKTVKTDKIIDELTIVTPAETIQLSLENGKWLLGTRKYPAADYSVDELLDGVSSIKLLEKVASTNTAGAIEKYEFIDGKEITVTAKSQGKTIRTLRIGKTSSTSSQTFVIVDDSSDIYLAAGNLNLKFNETEEHLRSKVVAEFDVDKISSINVNKADGSNWTISRDTSAKGESSWGISGAQVELDSSKVDTWVSGFSSIPVSKWLENAQDFEGNLECTVTVTENNVPVVFQIYKAPAETEDSAEKYYGKSSVTPYPFEIAQYVVSRFLKDLESLSI